MPGDRHHRVVVEAVLDHARQRSVAQRMDGDVAGCDIRALQRPLEDLSDRGVGLLRLRVREDPRVNSGPGGQESRDSDIDGSVLPHPAHQIH